jgi:TPR repeat protein
VIHDRPISFRFALALVLSIVCIVVPAWANFETGMDAYNRKDYATALREWQAQAEQGDADAQDFLGTLYFKGWGVPQDYTKARQWWEKAAAQGSASAQSDLGLLYANGLGGPQDLVQAHMWYSLAGGNGYEIATGYRNDLAKQMTPAQIAEAQQLARKWKPIKK